MGSDLPINYFVPLPVGRAFVGITLIRANITVNTFIGSMDCIYRSAICEHADR